MTLVVIDIVNWPAISNGCGWWECLPHWQAHVRFIQDWQTIITGQWHVLCWHFCAD